MGPLCFYYMENIYFIFLILFCFKEVKFYKYGWSLKQKENTKVPGAKDIETLNPIKHKFCELILHVNTEKITDFDLNHQIQ